MATITIGCKLPNGIRLSNPLKSGDTVILRGLNKGRILGPNGRPANPEYITTEVDSDFWTAWKGANKNFQPYKNGAIFEAKTEADAKARSKDAKKTGLEPLAPESMGVKAADKEDPK